jgi:hypothetical protein
MGQITKLKPQPGRLPLQAVHQRRKDAECGEIGDVYASQLAPSIASALKFLNQELTPPAAFVPSASTD